MVEPKDSGVVSHNTESANGNDDTPDTGLGGATSPVLDRGGLGGPETVGDNPPDAGQVPSADLHGVPLQPSEEGPSAEVRVQPSGDDALSHSVEGHTENLRGRLTFEPVYYNHRRRHGRYALILSGVHLECAMPAREGTTLTIYADEDGTWYARPDHEFNDGRFYLNLRGGDAD